ncbi:MAG: carboxypeptidase M32 [Emergencia sp.]|nr:carboxypeptidase M32 [Emergencia sp.]
MVGYYNKLAEFKKLISRIEYLSYTQNSLIYWDKLTYMPPGAISYRAKVLAFLADEQYKFMSSAEFNSYMAYFDHHKKNDSLTESMVAQIRQSAEYVQRIPEDEYQAYIQLIAVSEQVWEQAKEKCDFSLFQPYLEKIFSTFKRFTEYWGYEKDPYDALLNYYEPGLTTEKIDHYLAKLKPFLTELCGRIQPSNRSAISPCEILPVMDGVSQKALWEHLLKKMGFSFYTGRVDIGSHPTVLANSPDDVRIVNAYREDNTVFGLFNVMHSAGKGIYQQSISKDLLGTFLAKVPSFALEEGIGRFYENIIGRSKGFAEFFSRELADFSGGSYRLSAQRFYEEVNAVTPTPIRLQADELTYLLHVIIRYEIERELINDRLTIAELPEVWKQKYQEILGVTPASDAEGVLQDIHWAAGYVGYFPTYLVANLAAAQLAATIDTSCGHLDDLIAEGDFATVNQWLKENIFTYGAQYSTSQLLKSASGSPLSSQPYIDYLLKKYTEVYKL